MQEMHATSRVGKDQEDGESENWEEICVLNFWMDMRKCGKINALLALFVSTTRVLRSKVINSQNLDHVSYPRAGVASGKEVHISTTRNLPLAEFQIYVLQDNTQF
jgi:hypothetical protein